MGECAAQYPPDGTDSRSLDVEFLADWGSTNLALTLALTDGAPTGLKYLGGYSRGSELDGLARDAVSLLDMLFAAGVAPEDIAHSMSIRQIYDGASLPGSMISAIALAISNDMACQQGI